MRFLLILAAMTLDAQTVLHPTLAVDGRGNMAVAWKQGDAIQLKRFRGGKWGSPVKIGDGWAPSLALDPNGEPLIAWQDRTLGNDEIFFRRPGKAAENVSQTNTGYSRNPSLALDASGAPVLAWEEHYGSRADVWIRRSTAKGWKDLEKHPGMYVFPQKLSAATYVSLSLDKKGEPSVAWLDDAEGDPQVYLRRWASGRWQNLAIVSKGKGPASSLTFAADTLCWQQNGRVHVQQAGKPLGEISGEAAWPRMVLDGAGKPLVAFRAAGQVKVLRWSGAAWQSVGSVKWNNPPTSIRDDERQLALASAGNQACVAWAESQIQTACFTLPAP